MYLSKLFMYFAIFFFSPAALANEVAGQMDLTDSWYGVITVLVFIIAYGLVIGLGYAASIWAHFLVNAKTF